MFIPQPLLPPVLSRYSVHSPASFSSEEVTLHFHPELNILISVQVQTSMYALPQPAAASRYDHSQAEFVGAGESTACRVSERLTLSATCSAPLKITKTGTGICSSLGIAGIDNGDGTVW